MGIARFDVAIPELIAEAKPFGQFKNDPGVGVALRQGFHNCRAILQVSFPAGRCSKAVVRLAISRKLVAGKHVVAEFRGRRHEEISGYAELQALSAWRARRESALDMTGLEPKLKNALIG